MENKSCVESNVKLEDTGFGYTLSLIGGNIKWLLYINYMKILLLWDIMN